MRIFRLPILGLMAVVAAAAAGLVALRYSTPNVAGATILVTLLGLGLSILAAVNRHEARRAFWVGFALMGWGYILFSGPAWTLSIGEIEHHAVGDLGGEFDSPHQEPILAHWLPTTALLDALRPLVQRGGGAGTPPDRVASLLGFPDQRSRAIAAALDRPLDMPFAEGATLQDVLDRIQGATRSRELPEGIPIYVDPVGLEEAEKTTESTVRLSLIGVPLRTSLPLLLQQLDLKYTVDEGLLTITSISRRAPFSGAAVQSFRRVGHCLISLASALLGGMAGLTLHATRPDRNSVTPER